MNMVWLVADQWRELDLISRLVAVQSSLSSEDASPITADGGVRAEKCGVEATPPGNVRPYKSGNKLFQKLSQSRHNLHAAVV